MNQGEFFSCKLHVLQGFDAVLKDLSKAEFMNVVVRKAKSKKCSIEGCKKSGVFLILFQYFPYKSNKMLQ